jgi:hypothetical protein
MNPKTSSPATTPMSLYQRVGKYYLILTGCLYLLTGIIGLVGNGFFAVDMWDAYLVIPPFPILIILQKCSSFPNCSIHGFAYNSSLEPLKDNFLSFTIIVIVLGALAIWAAFAAAKKNRVGQAVWAALACAAFLAALGNVAADKATYGLYPYSGPVSMESVFRVCLSVSYAIGVALVSVKREA